MTALYSITSWKTRKFNFSTMGPSNIAKMEKLLGAAYLSVELYLLYKRKLGTSIEYEINLCPSIKVLSYLHFSFTSLPKCSFLHKTQYL